MWMLCVIEIVFLSTPAKNAYRPGTLRFFKYTLSSSILIYSKIFMKKLYKPYIVFNLYCLLKRSIDLQYFFAQTAKTVNYTTLLTTPI